MNNLITIIIPTYNREKVIKNAIKSVLNQSYQNFEIVIVDDGSTDSTTQTITKVINQDSRIIYIKHPSNLGSQAARNTGIKSAKGDWITFLDSDDQLLPNSIKLRLDLALQKQVKVVHSECYVIYSDNNKLLFGVPPLEGRIYPNLLSAPGPVFPALFVLKDAFEKINYLDEKIVAYQEWDTVIRLAKYYEFAFVSEPTFNYDCRGTDNISKNLLRSANGYKQIIDKHWKDIIKYAGVNTLFRHYFILSQQYMNVDKKKGIIYRILAYFYLPIFVLDVSSKAKNILKRVLRLNK